MRKITAVNIKLIAIFAITIFAGCATPKTAAIESPVYQEKSNFFSRGETRYYGDSITLQQPVAGKPDFSFFRLNYTITKKARIWHASTFYLSKNLILDPTVTFELDGNVHTFTPEPRSNKGYGRLRKGYAEETNQFVLPNSLIDNLKKSSSVVIRFSGQNYSQAKVLDRNEIGHLIYFINHINSLII
jgi:hypothetical protein